MAYTAKITTQTSVNLKPEDEERQVTDNLTLIVYPDQTVELRMLHDETPAQDNATVNMLFELIKENETYSGSAEATIIPPEDELGPFANISSLSINGTYVDGQLRSTGAIHFLEGIPIAAIFIEFNISETERAFRIELEDSFLPIMMNETTGAPQPFQPLEIPPEVFIEMIQNITNMLNFEVENCTVEIVETAITPNKAFAKINVTTNEDFILGEFTGITNVTAFFNASNFIENITISGLWKGKGNAKLQFELFAEFTNGAPSQATLSILLTESADKWTFTTDGEFTFANDPFFALTSLDLRLVFEGNATEAFTDLNKILMRTIPPGEEPPPFEDIIEFQSNIFEALSAIEIEEVSFQISYASGQFSAEGSFKISGNVEEAIAEAKDIFLDFIAEMEPKATEQLGYQFLSKTDIKPEYIRLEVQQSPARLIGKIIIKRIKTETVGNATYFRYPLLFEVLNETEYAGTATLKIIGGENETHQVYLHTPEDVPEPMEQTDRYAIWNMTAEDFNMTALGEVMFESRQVVFPIVIAGQETEIEVVANVSGVTIVNVSYETGYTMLGTTKGLKFVVSGPSGTVATVNITIPKDVVPEGAQLTVYVGDEQVPATIIETETEYIIMVTVHFSEVIIYVEFTTPVERYLFALIGGVVVLLLIIIGAATLLKKKR